MNCAAETEYANRRGTLHRPEECFRIVTANTDENAKTADPNYLDAYTLMLTPQGADLSTAWGSSVKWKTDPFKGHTCGAMEFEATEHIEMDVCDMLFQNELDTALAAGWGGAKGTSIVYWNNAATPAALDDTPTAADDRVLGSLRIAAPVINTRTQQQTRFATLWFSNNDGGKNEADTDLYDDTDTGTAGIQPEPLMFALLDEDNDSKFGDFGKVDLAKRDSSVSSSTAAGAWVIGSDGTAENGGSTADNKCSDDDGGDDCDAEFSEEIEIKFASGTALGCTDTRTVTLTCTWDASGEMGRYRSDDHEDNTADGSSAAGLFAGFETDGASGARAPGYIGAFVKCTVK